MATYQPQLRLNNQILNSSHHWHAGFSAFPTHDLHVRGRNNGLRNRVFLTENNVHEFRQLQFLDDSIVVDGLSLSRDGGLQQLDDSIILDGESLEAAGDNQRAVKAVKEERVEASTDCSICLESVGVGEIVARMPCSHVFHKTCITRWLRKKPSCPLCRAPVC